MSKRTSKYQMTYFEEGDISSSKAEMQRWETIDSQLQSLYQVIGNGILEGWELTASDGLNIVITPGSGQPLVQSSAGYRATLHSTPMTIAGAGG